MIKISIIGGGVAGYSAAMALARSHIDVNLFTGFSHGGQIVLAPHLNNYPGIETSGTQLIANMHKQVLDWKVKVYEDVAIEKICLDENLTLIDSNGNEFVNDAITKQIESLRPLVLHMHQYLQVSDAANPHL